MDLIGILISFSLPLIKTLGKVEQWQELLNLPITVTSRWVQLSTWQLVPLLSEWPEMDLLESKSALISSKLPLNKELRHSSWLRLYFQSFNSTMSNGQTTKWHLCLQFLQLLAISEHMLLQLSQCLSRDHIQERGPLTEVSLIGSHKTTILEV